MPPAVSENPILNSPFAEPTRHFRTSSTRHAYFTGADEPYEKLKRALRAEIDEAAWASLYRTVSRPFATPETGKLAVKRSAPLTIRIEMTEPRLQRVLKITSFDDRVLDCPWG